MFGYLRAFFALLWIGWVSRHDTEWRPGPGGFFMRRRVHGQWQHRPMTGEEKRDHLLNGW